MARFSEEQIACAKAVPLIEYIEKRGYEFKREGKYARLVEHDSLVISIDGNWWKWNSEGIGGDTIDFLVSYEKKSFRDAVAELIGDFPIERIERVRHRAPLPASVKTEAAAERVLPPRNDNHNRVYAYLTKTRKIAPSIVRDLIDKNELYESAGTHNAVFVRYIDGVPRYCFQRGTCSFLKPFRGELWPERKEYAWLRIGAEQRTIYVFEAVIDALSFATIAMRLRMDWRKLTLITLGGNSLLALHRYLADHPNTERIVVCTDNDEGGRSACDAIRVMYEGDYAVSRLTPNEKDWNDMLVSNVDPKFQTVRTFFSTFKKKEV